MEKIDVGTGGAHSQVAEMEKLNETMEKQRTEIARLRNLLDLTGAGKVSGFDLGSCSKIKSNHVKKKKRSSCLFFTIAKLF